MSATITEKDCKILGRAGRLARQRGLIGRNEQLTCDCEGCVGLDCNKMKNPSYVTLYLAQSGNPVVLTGLQRFDRRLEGYARSNGLLQ